MGDGAGTLKVRGALQPSPLSQVIEQRDTSRRVLRATARNLVHTRYYQTQNGGRKEETEPEQSTDIEFRFFGSNLKRSSCKTCGAWVKMSIIFHNSTGRKKSIVAQMYLL